MNIEKSGSEIGSHPYTKEERVALVQQTIKDALAKRNILMVNSGNSAQESTNISVASSTRKGTSSTIEANGKKPEDALLPPQIASLTTAELVKVSRSQSDDAKHARSALALRSDEGDMDAYSAIAKEYEHIYEGLSILGRNVLKTLVKNAVGEERKMTQIIVAADILKVRDQLAGVCPSPLETLLSERIAICQAVLNWFELSYFQTTSFHPSMNLLYQSRITMAQSRLVQAIKALAQVRKLQLPSVQVNISEKQVNVA